MSSTVLAIVAIVVVAALALLMRRAANRGGDFTITPPPDEGAARPSVPPTSFADDLDDDDLDDEDAPGRPVLVTSEGIALIPANHSVRLIPLLKEEAVDVPEWLTRGIEDGAVPYTAYNQVAGLTSHRDRGPASGTVLSAGDYTAARIRRNSQGLWCVETLGRDGDYGFLPFGSEAGARGALELLENKKVIQHVLDENGDPVPPSPEDFEEARRRYEETERELAIAADEDEPPPGDWSSRR